MQQPTIVIMIGIPASGKSTFCKKYLPDLIRINLDTLKTRNKENKMLESCLTEKLSFVVDNTNPTKNDRARYIPLAKAAGYRVIGCFMESRISPCIARNELRRGKEQVPTSAILNISNKLEMPSKSEGFDELYFVKFEGHEMTISPWREEHEI